MDDIDSLSDWVAIKEKPFLTSTISAKQHIYVAWNDIDKMLAVTCSNIRCANDTKADGWSCVLSINELQSVHDQLCLVTPKLEPNFPNLPTKSHSLWAGNTYYVVLNIAR